MHRHGKWHTFSVAVVWRRHAPDLGVIRRLVEAPRGDRRGTTQPPSPATAPLGEKAYSLRNPAPNL
jgi:hypothetical protein